MLASGAAAVSGGRPDYPAFWRYLFDVAREIVDNGLCPAYCCVCLPEQVLANAEIGHFTGVHFLALVSDEATVRARIRRRRGAPSAAGRLALHVGIDAALRTATVPAPHTDRRLPAAHDSTRANFLTDSTATTRRRRQQNPLISRRGRMISLDAVAPGPTSGCGRCTEGEVGEDRR